MASGSGFVKAFFRSRDHGKSLLLRIRRRWFQTDRANTMASRETKRRRAPIKIGFSPPETWEETLNKIRAMRKMNKAPVDTMGCDKCHDESADDKVTVLFKTY